MNFDPFLIADAKSEISLVPFGFKGGIKRKWRNRLKVSMGHLHKLIEDAAQKRQRKGKIKKPELYEWAPIIFQIKKRPPEEAGEISTENAIAIAVKQGLLPPEAADVSPATYNTIARKKGWTKKTIKAVRFQAERPNQAHHFDASTSKFLYIAKPIGEKDYLLKLHRPAKHYKNKPIPVDDLRPWIYGLADDYSGRFMSRYAASKGESPNDSVDFLFWAWSQIGLPEQFLFYQKKKKKTVRSKNFIERLGIELPEMMPFKSRGHGKIERPWRTNWDDFEKLFFASHLDWKKDFAISMTELNQELSNYLRDKYNRRTHRFEKNITRMQAWSRISLYGGIIQIPENALATIAIRARRKVGIDGTVQFEGKTYEVKGLYDATVDLLKGVFAERKDYIVAQDIKTGINYEVEPFVPLNLNEFKSFNETPHQILVKESTNLALTGVTLYADRKPENEKVISMPLKTKEHREIEDPFDVDHYATLAEAMNDFMSYMPGTFFNSEMREVIEKEIEANGLSKKFVENFALEVRAQMSKRIAV